MCVLTPTRGLNYRQKKLKRNAKVSSQANDRDDIFVFRSSGAAKKAKPARKQAAAPASKTTPAPLTVPAPTSHHVSPQQPVAARAAAAAADDEDSDDAAEARQEEQMRAMQEHMKALAMAKAAQEQKSAANAAATRSMGGDKKAADRFTHQFDRKVLGTSDGTNSTTGNIYLFFGQ